MKPKLTYFYTNECSKCKELKPVIKEMEQIFEIIYVNTYEEDLITESSNIEWVPALILEDETGKHKFEGKNEIVSFLQKVIS